MVIFAWKESEREGRWLAQFGPYVRRVTHRRYFCLLLKLGRASIRPIIILSIWSPTTTSPFFVRWDWENIYLIHHLFFFFLHLLEMLLCRVHLQSSSLDTLSNTRRRRRNCKWKWRVESSLEEDEEIEIDQKKAREALKRLDQQLQTLSQPQPLSPSPPAPPKPSPLPGTVIFVT